MDQRMTQILLSHPPWAGLMNQRQRIQTHHPTHQHSGGTPNCMRWKRSSCLRLKLFLTIFSINSMSKQGEINEPLNQSPRATLKQFNVLSIVLMQQRGMPSEATRQPQGFHNLWCSSHQLGPHYSYNQASTSAHSSVNTDHNISFTRSKFRLRCCHSSDYMLISCLMVRFSGETSSVSLNMRMRMTFCCLFLFQS